MKYNRRALLKDALLLTGAAMTVRTLPVDAAILPELKETDPEAVAIDYHRNAREIDKSKFPTYEDGQVCANCGLVGFSSGIRKPCQLITGKLVNGGGWCSSWTPKY